MTAPEIPAEIIEAAAHAIFAQEQCDKRQAKDVPYQWNTRLDEADHEEYRDLARAALAATWPLIAAHVLNKAAGEIALADRLDKLTATDINAAEFAAEAWLRAQDIALTEPREEIEEPEDDRIYEPFATTGIPLGATLTDCNDDVWVLVGNAADGEAVWEHDGEQADLDRLFGDGLAPFRLDWWAAAQTPEYRWTAQEEAIAAAEKVVDTVTVNGRTFADWKETWS